MKTVEIVHVRETFGKQGAFDGYMTVHTFHTFASKDLNAIKAFASKKIKVDIPDRFHPKEDEEGRVIVTVGGKTVSLSNVLGVGKNGDPVIEWLDEEGGFKRTVSLKVHPAATFKNGSGFYNYANGEEIEVQPDGQK